MAELYFKEDTPQHVCWDRKYYNTFQDQLKVLTTSKTIYVGNLSFFTTEQQIHEAFSVVGPVKRIIMGLNQHTKTPCGFCFVEYYSREQAAACLKFVSGTVCDDRIIRCDMDGGFRPGRQFGRGPSGGQMRDDRMSTSDPARGGGGALRAIRPAPVTGKRGRDGEQVDAFGREIKRDPLMGGLSASRGAPKDNASSADAAGADVSMTVASSATEALEAAGAEEDGGRDREEEDEYTDGRNKRSRRED